MYIQRQQEIENKTAAARKGRAKARRIGDVIASSIMSYDFAFC
jgi:hypothetical protein